MPSDDVAVGPWLYECQADHQFWVTQAGAEYLMESRHGRCPAKGCPARGIVSQRAPALASPETGT